MSPASPDGPENGAQPAARPPLAAAVGAWLARLADRPGPLWWSCLAAIALLKFREVGLPPVWDAAFSVFPAAGWLTRHGFDWNELLRQPGYMDGGPNCHAMSLVTAYTAVVLKLAGSPARAWVVLHLVTWLLGTTALTASVRIARRLFSAPVALAFGFLCLCWPLILAQLGQMYLEIPLLCAAAVGALALLRGQWLVASLAVLLATSVKESGVIVAGALAGALLTARGADWRAWAKAAGVAGPSVVMALISLTRSAGSGLAAPGRPSAGLLDRAAMAFWLEYDNFLVAVPDLLWLLVAAGLLAAAAAVLGAVRRLRGAGARTVGTLAVGGGVAAYDVVVWLVLCFITFHFLVFPQVARDFSFLPRYAVPYLPFLVLMLLLPLRARGCPARVLAVLLVAGGLAGLFNRGGILYTVPRRVCPAVAERSEEYLDAYRTYRDGLREGLAAVPDHATIVCALPEYFLLSYPELGYTERRFSGLVNVARRAPPPGADPLYLVAGYPFLGGQHTYGLWRWAKAQPSRSVAVRYRGGHGWFRLAVVKVAMREPASDGP